MRQSPKRTHMAPSSSWKGRTPARDVLLDRTPCFDLFDTRVAAHHMQLESLERVLIEVLGDVPRCRLLRLELIVFHSNSQRLVVCAVRAPPGAGQAVRAQDRPEALSSAPQDLVELHVRQLQ